METVVIKYDGGNKAVRQVLDGLKKMGAITIERTIYDDAMVAKIARGERDLAAGKGVVIDPSKLWN